MLPAGRYDGAWLLPSFLQKGGVNIMSDFEIMTLIIAMFMLVFTILGYNKK